MKSLLFCGLWMGIAVGLVGCAKNGSSGSSSSAAVYSSDAPQASQSRAEYVYDPIKGRYYWERDGLPLTSQYE